MLDGKEIAAEVVCAVRELTDAELQAAGRQPRDGKQRVVVGRRAGKPQYVHIDACDAEHLDDDTLADVTRANMDALFKKPWARGSEGRTGRKGGKRGRR